MGFPAEFRKNPKIIKTKCVCSDHFESHFCRGKKRKFLTSDAIRTIIDCEHPPWEAPPKRPLPKKRQLDIKQKNAAKHSFDMENEENFDDRMEEPTQKRKRNSVKVKCKMCPFFQKKIKCLNE